MTSCSCDSYKKGGKICSCGDAYKKGGKVKKDKKKKSKRSKTPKRKSRSSFPLHMMPYAGLGSYLAQTQNPNIVYSAGSAVPGYFRLQAPQRAFGDQPTAKMAVNNNAVQPVIEYRSRSGKDELAHYENDYDEYGGSQYPYAPSTIGSISSMSSLTRGLQGTLSQSPSMTSLRAVPTSPYRQASSLSSREAGYIPVMSDPTIQAFPPTSGNQMTPTSAFVDAPHSDYAPLRGQQPETTQGDINLSKQVGLTVPSIRIPNIPSTPVATSQSPTHSFPSPSSLARKSIPRVFPAQAAQPAQPAQPSLIRQTMPTLSQRGRTTVVKRNDPRLSSIKE